MNVLGTGLTGLVGSRIVELLSPEHSFENISRKTGIDILDGEELMGKFRESFASVVLHFAAKTDVDGCEKDKEEDIKILRYKDIKRQKQEWNDKKTAWAVNVLGTQNIVAACEQSGKKLIYISTDFVFDGKNPPPAGYEEESIPHPVNWYGQTKFEGEKVVQESSIPWTIIRIAYPYRASFEKKDFARAMIDRFKNNQPIPAITDQLITPTFIDDFAVVISRVIEEKSTGILHAAGSKALSPYEIAHYIARCFSFDQSLIIETAYAAFFANRAPRPFHSIIRNAKIARLGIKMHSFEKSLEIIKKQIQQ